MKTRTNILSRFSDTPNDSLLFLPDLTLWYKWHTSHGTLPEKWKTLSLPEIARDFGFPVWLTVRPWSVETPGIEITTTEERGERIIRTETSAGVLISRWSLGPDADWWQTEYPVKNAEDLKAVLELARSMTYTPDATELTRLAEMVGDEGVVALELPQRPYSDLLHNFLGWSEGLCGRVSWIHHGVVLRTVRR